MRLKDSPLPRDLDRILAIAGAIVSLILIVYLGKEIGRVVYLITGILALISCLLWLSIRKSHPFEFGLPVSRNLTALWSICFFELFTLSILSLHFRPQVYERPLLYFVLTALMAGTIACKIISSSRRHATLILIQVVLLGVSIAWSQLLIFSSIIGVDPWYHYALTSGIISDGLIPGGYSYAKLPLFHLIIASNSLIAGLPYKLAAMISVSLGQIICNAIFIFLIAGRLFRDYRAELLAALMVIIANHHIFMSYWSIPNSFAAVFIPIALYLLFFKFGDRPHASSAILYILVLAAIILTHTITAMCMAILLFVGWITLVIYRAYDHSGKDNHVSLIRPVGFTVAMFAWWAFAATSSIGSLAKLIEWGFSIDVFFKTPKEFQGYAAAIPLGEQLFNNLGMFLFFALSFVGIFYMVSWRGNISSFAMAWIGIAPLVIGFFSLISEHTVVEQRWWYFAQILLSIPLAAAILILGTWKLKRLTQLYGFIFGFIVILSFLMIISPPANVDNSMFSPNMRYRAALIDSELQAQTIINHYNGIIKSDKYYAGRLEFSGYNAESFCREIAVRNLSDMKGDLVLIRDTILTDPFMFFSSTYKLDYNLDDLINSAGFSRIYDSGSVGAYL